MNQHDQQTQVAADKRVTKPAMVAQLSPQPPSRAQAQRRWRVLLVAAALTSAALAFQGLKGAEEEPDLSTEAAARAEIEAHPGNAQAHAALAEFLQQREQIKEAREHARIATTLDPGDPDLHNTYGLLLANDGNLADSVSEFQAAVTLAPEETKYRFDLALALQSLGRAPEAEEAYKQLLRLDPTNSMAHNNLGALFVDSGSFLEAGREFREALRLDPGNELARKNQELISARELAAFEREMGIPASQATGYRSLPMPTDPGWTSRIGELQAVGILH